MGFLDKQRTIAGPGFNRWLVPPAALAIHLSIGMAYGFSVFWMPLEHAVGISKSIACDAKTGSALLDWFQGVVGYGTHGPCDWKRSSLAWVFTLFFVFLGSSAAVFGHWLEREGPRKAGVVAACCWGSGFLISALGVYCHQIWWLWVGSGVIGGIGLGLGYISPVSTLIKWFPDRRGMATGLAIMGFGGGAIIGAPLADRLMKYYATPVSVGVWETFVTLGFLYFLAMVCGAFAYRVPRSDWKPAGWTPPAQKSSMVTSRHVHLATAHKTPQFWLLWAVLCLNVSAGIGVIAVASPMLQEILGGTLIGVNKAFNELNPDELKLVATIAAAFTSLVSLFNSAGRIFWATLSDYIGRQRTYFIFFAAGMLLYTSVPFVGKLGNVGLFVSVFCLIYTMYGGGFATIPAYLADVFGTQFVGAIHGRLLTAWSTAGVIGPLLVTSLREYQIAHNVPSAQAYNTTMFVLAGLLLLGFCCNLAMRPVAERFYMTDEQLARERSRGHEGSK